VIRGPVGGNHSERLVTRCGTQACELHARCPSDVEVLPHPLKDTVLRHCPAPPTVLSRSTLALFIDAVGFKEARQKRPMRNLGGGSGRYSVLSGREG